MIEASKARTPSGCGQPGFVDDVRYRIVVEGELGPRFATVFEGMSIEHLDGDTVIVGTVVDQSQLQGVLEQIGRLGLKLVSLMPADSS